MGLQGNHQTGVQDRAPPTGAKRRHEAGPHHCSQPASLQHRPLCRIPGCWPLPNTQSRCELSASSLSMRLIGTSRAGLNLRLELPCYVSCICKPQMAVGTKPSGFAEMSLGVFHRTLSEVGTTKGICIMSVIRLSGINYSRISLQVTACRGKPWCVHRFLREVSLCGRHPGRDGGGVCVGAAGCGATGERLGIWPRESEAAPGRCVLSRCAFHCFPPPKPTRSNYSTHRGAFARQGSCVMRQCALQCENGTANCCDLDAKCICAAGLLCRGYS